MTLLVLDRTPLTLKLRTVIRAVTLGSSTLSCEIARPPAPVNGEDVPRCPYVVLWPLEGSFAEGATLGLPEGCGWLPYQLTAVGENAEQAERAMDKVRAALLGMNGSGYITDLNTSTVKVGGRMSEGPGALDTDSRLFNLPERFAFLASAA